MWLRIGTSGGNKQEGRAGIEFMELRIETSGGLL